MSYAPTVWENEVTPRSPANLNNLESQYANALADIIPCEPGIIVMFSGLISNIPSGWVICDGNNGTQNLLGKFLKSVANILTNPGATGGSTNKTTNSHYHATGVTSPSGGHSHHTSTEYGDGGSEVDIITGTWSSNTHTHTVPNIDSVQETINNCLPPYT